MCRVVAGQIRTFLILLGCLQLCVGVDGVLQVIAWSRMVVNYSSEAGIAKGVSMTFDGQHPCQLCKAITRSKKQQDDPSQPKNIQLLDPAFKSFLSPATIHSPNPRSTEFHSPGFVPLCEVGSIFGERPPLQPPRAVSAC